MNQKSFCCFPFVLVMIIKRMVSILTCIRTERKNCFSRLDATLPTRVVSACFLSTAGETKCIYLVRRFLLVAACVLLVSTILSAGPSGYHVTKTIKLGGDGGWDYLTVNARRVYISRGTHVMVVDADTGALVGDIPNTNGYAVALAYARASDTMFKKGVDSL